MNHTIQYTPNLKKNQYESLYNINMIHYDIAMTTEKHKIPPFPLRLDKKLRDALTECAKENTRSLNSEIAVRLQASLKNTNNLDEQKMKELLREVIREELNKK